MAQPVPMFDPEFRPGDNLYTNSAIALNVDTGAIEWFFQYTPNESWDYDEHGVHILIDAPFEGEGSANGGALRAQRLLLPARSH